MNPHVIITNMKKRYTGVSGTINALLPVLAEQLSVGFVGNDLPGAALAQSMHPSTFTQLSIWEAIRISRKRLPDGRKRIWHVRRDPEMMLALFLRDVLRCPIHIVFTSAAQRYHSIFPRWLISRMDAVIATTAEAANYVNAAAVVPHGIDTYRFTPPDNKLDAWKQTGLHGKYGIGIFGRIRPEKGTDIFVEAMLKVLPEFPEYTAIIAGLCQPQFTSYQRSLQDKIAAHNLSNRLCFVGEIAPEKMGDWYQNCLITVACPRYEGYGLTALEGMACGCAIVASDAGIFKAVIEDGVSGFVVPIEDVNALADALRAVMRVAAHAVQMGLHGRQFVQKNYSSKSEATGIAAVYQRLWNS